MTKYIYKKEEARTIQKFGVDITLYDANAPSTLVYEEVEKGHMQEWYSDISTYQWFIIDGSGTYVVNGEKFSVSKGDLVVVPPKHNMYYYGNMKMVLITTPKYEEINEHEVRLIPEEDLEK